MSAALRRSNRKRPSSLYSKDFDYESPMLKVRGKIELNPEEKELLQTVEEAKRYCLCQCTETEDKGSVMIACDGCDDWFHISCLGISPDDANEMETFLCPACSAQEAAKRPKKAKRSSQPSQSDIQMLANVLSGISEEKVKKRKYATDYRTTPKISAFHLATPVAYGRVRNIVGYLCNDSHPSPSRKRQAAENGYMAPITQMDLTRGYVTTRWGVFKIWPGEENRIHVLSDFSMKQPPPDVLKEEPDSGVAVGLLKIDRRADKTIFSLEGVETGVEKKDMEVNLSGKMLEELAECLQCGGGVREVQETVRRKLKYRPTILSKSS